MVTAANLATPLSPIPQAEDDTFAQLLWSMRDQNRALQTQNEVLRQQVTALSATNHNLVQILDDQTRRIAVLGERVNHLVREIDALRTDRNAAVEENAENRGTSVERAAQIRTQTEELRIAHLQTTRSQLSLRLRCINDSLLGTQSIFAGAGAIAGGFWGAFLGPVGALAGIVVGATTTVFASKGDIEAKVLNERTQIETDLRQIDLQLAFLGRS